MDLSLQRCFENGNEKVKVPVEIQTALSITPLKSNEDKRRMRKTMLWLTGNTPLLCSEGAGMDNYHTCIHSSLR